MTKVNPCCFEELFHTRLDPIPSEIIENCGVTITIKRYHETSSVQCNICNEYDNEPKQRTRIFVKEYLTLPVCDTHGCRTCKGWGHILRLNCAAIKYLLKFNEHIRWLEDKHFRVYYCDHTFSDESHPYIEDILWDGDRCHEHRTNCDHCKALIENETDEYYEYYLKLGKEIEDRKAGIQPCPKDPALPLGGSELSNKIRYESRETIEIEPPKES